MSCISLQRVSKTYGSLGAQVQALKKVDLEIAKGEMVAIMGPSGSGKSTMLNIMGCLDVPSSGHYYLKGEKVSDLHTDELARARNVNIGFVFQQFNLLNEYTAQENVELPLIYRGQFEKKILKNERINKAISLLKKVGLGDHIHKRPSELSGGEQQRVAIARALVGDPSIILADEPTGALDQKTGEGIMELLLEINRSGKTVVIVTHDSKVASYCNRIIHMEDGCVK